MNRSILPAVDGAEYPSRGLRLLRIGTFSIGVSYGVLIALFALLVVTAIASAAPGNSELPRVAALGFLFWVSGWLIQSLTFLAASRVVGLRQPGLTLGVLGVEMEPRPCRPQGALLLSLATATSLIVLATLYRLLEAEAQPTFSRGNASSIWFAPSFGFSKHDSIWRTAAWLCWVQAVLQLYPLPRTLGRQLVGSLTAIWASAMEPPAQESVFRRCLAGISVLMMGIVVTSLIAEVSMFGVQWIVLMAMSLLLWTSSRGKDVGGILACYRSQPGELVFDSNLERSGRHRCRLQEEWLAFRMMLRQLGFRRRLRAVQRRERGEAVDARELDDILLRLHRDGPQSLSTRDRRILDRVSQTLRRRRRDESPDERSSE